MKGERRMNITSWLICGGIIVAGIAMVSKIIGSDNLGKNKSNKKSDSKQNREKPSENKRSIFGWLTEEKPLEEKPKINRHNIEKVRNEIKILIDEYWDLEELYLKTEGKFKLYRNLFCEEGGILSYIQRLDGLYHYDLDEYQDISQLKIKIGGQLINGLYNTISLKMEFHGNSFSVSDKFNISMSKKAFINNENLNVDDIEDIEKLKANKRLVESKKRNLDNDLRNLNSDKDNKFYEDLWDKAHVKIEELIEQYKNGSIDEFTNREELIQYTKERFLELKAFLGKRIAFKYYDDIDIAPEEKRNFFIVVERGDNCPAIIIDEAILLLKGKITKLKAEERKDI